MLFACDLLRCVNAACSWPWECRRLPGIDAPELGGPNDDSQSQGMLEEGRVVTVRGLLKGLYEKACQQKMWGLVRHTAGMLGKRVEDLAKAVTDLLVRQKQVRWTDFVSF